MITKLLSRLFQICELLGTIIVSSLPAQMEKMDLTNVTLFYTV